MHFSANIGKWWFYVHCVLQKPSCPSIRFNLTIKLQNELYSIYMVNSLLLVLLFCCRRHPILISIFLYSTIRLIAQISSWPRVDMIITAINQEKVYSHNLIECQNLMGSDLKLVSKPVQLLSAVYCGNTILQATAAYLVPVLLTKPCNGNWLKGVSSVKETLGMHFESVPRTTTTILYLIKHDLV